MPFRASTLALALLLSVPADAAVPTLLRDLDGRPTEADGHVYPAAVVGDRVVFTAFSVGLGVEPWSSDGTAVGTQPLVDTHPGAHSGGMRVLGSTSELLFFMAATGNNRELLWRTDGTVAGTFPLGVTTSSFDHDLASTVAAGRLYLMVSSSPGRRLYISDGTLAGTAVVRDFPHSGSLSGMATAADLVYFFAGHPQGQHGLWRSEGTADSTLLLANIGHDFPFAAPPITAAGSRVFFIADGGPGQELWASDGTVAGTGPVTSFATPEPFGPTRFLRPLGNEVVFLADDVVNGSELWRSDGTAAGTRRITDFGFHAPFEHDYRPEYLEPFGDRLLFTATDGLNGHRLWTTDGDPASTAPLVGCPGGCPVPGAQFSGKPILLRLGAKVLFSAWDSARGEELWVSDGTGGGTRPITNCPGVCGFRVDHMDSVGGLAYLFGGSTGADYGLWRTNGTAAGTAPLVTGLRAAEPPTLLHRWTALGLGGKAYFAADSGAEIGTQLWSSDGTSEGTEMVALIGATASVGSHPSDLQPLGERLLFEARNGADNRLAWTSDGTESGTTVLDLPPGDSFHWIPALAAGATAFRLSRNQQGQVQLWATTWGAAGPQQLTHFAADTWVGRAVEWEGEALFPVATPLDGLQLWRSDGTVAGTRLAVDFPGSVPQFNFRKLEVLGPDMFIIVHGSQGAEEVWISDGTTAGTRHLVTPHGSELPEEPHFTRVGDSVYFLAPDFSNESAIWRTDGTAAGTARVFGVAIHPGTGYARHLRGFGGALYYFASVGSPSYELSFWRLDEGSDQPVFLAQLAPPTDELHELPPWYAELEGVLYLFADDGVHGAELWRTDGTPAGTRLVEDIFPGPRSAGGSATVAAGDELFFAADDGEHGRELWRSDGTAAGTRMVADLWPGPAGSATHELTTVGELLYFVADDGLVGEEVWALPLDPAAPSCAPSATALCLRGGRFRVEARWRDFADNTGVGHAVGLTGDTGYFWFFDPANVEAIVKVLDGQGVNGHYWAFYGALSNVEYHLTVIDTTTGASRRYANPSGRFASLGDTQAFGPLGATGSDLTLDEGERTPVPPLRSDSTVAAAPCVPSSSRLCLNDGRFAVEVDWHVPHLGDGVGTAVPLTTDTGYFWFFGPNNVELVLKVLDGRPVNGKFWVFYGALSNVEYTITVTDSETGQQRTYHNPQGRMASVGDTGAF